MSATRIEPSRSVAAWVSPAAWVLLNALGMGTALNLLAALYFVNFLVNACQSLTLRSERLFAAGLWLFLLCDVCVGLRNQPSLLPGLAGAAQAGVVPVDLALDPPRASTSG